MNVDLSKTEVEMLDAALECWEKEAQAQAAFSGLLSAVLTPKKEGEEDRFEGKLTKTFEDAGQKTKQRRIQSTLLRAKLFQALARQPEHDVEPIAP